MSESGSDKRKHERLPVVFPLIVRDGARQVGIIEDISKGGMRVKLDTDTELGECTEVREWTGKKGVDNREYILEQLVGDEFNLSISYMSVTMGLLKARLVRVIRHSSRLFFAMQFIEPDEKIVERIMNLVKKRAG